MWRERETEEKREREGGGRGRGDKRETQRHTERQILRLHKVAGKQCFREALTHALSRSDKNVPSFAFSLDVDFPKVTQFL